MPRIHLLTRADDLGSFAGATPSAIDAHRRGILRNASVMVPTPWFTDTVERLRDVPSLCIGVHLTICCEWNSNRWRPLLPAAQVPSLVDKEGWFKRSPGHIHEEGTCIAEVLGECQAQLDLARASGLKVTYVDTHMAWDWMHERSGPPRLEDLMPEWSRRNGVRWYRTPPVAGLSAPPVAQNDRRADLLARLEYAAPGTYLAVIHPCWAGSAIAVEDLGRVGTSVQSERVADAALFADPTLFSDFSRLDVSTIRYDELQ